MKNKEFTIGRGIATAGKWLAIMGMVIALFQFAQFLLRFQAGYLDTLDGYRVKEPIVRESCGTASPDYRSECCERQFGPGYYWKDNKCTFEDG